MVLLGAHTQVVMCSSEFSRKICVKHKECHAMTMNMKWDHQSLFAICLYPLKNTQNVRILTFSLGMEIIFKVTIPIICTDGESVLYLFSLKCYLVYGKLENSTFRFRLCIEMHGCRHHVVLSTAITCWRALWKWTRSMFYIQSIRMKRQWMKSCRTFFNPFFLSWSVCWAWRKLIVKTSKISSLAEEPAWSLPKIRSKSQTAFFGFVYTSFYTAICTSTSLSWQRRCSTTAKTTDRATHTHIHKNDNSNKKRRLFFHASLSGLFFHPRRMTSQGRVVHSQFILAHQ